MKLLLNKHEVHVSFKLEKILTRNPDEIFPRVEIL